MSEDEKNPYKPFPPEPVEPKYPRDRGFLVTHTRLAIELDDKTRSVRGVVTLTVRPIHALGRIELDGDDMRIEAIQVDGKAARFEHTAPHLFVYPARKLKEGVDVSVEIQYEARPTKGLYFIQPDKSYPDKPTQIWSQGESEDNHNWFPGYDYPNNKATSEALLTVRDPLVAFSNGHLVGRTKARAGWSTYHWKQDVAQPNYLIAVVVGEFDEVQDTWEDVPLHYFVPKGQKEWARETFKHTKEILTFFSKVTGYRYPYPKYAQAVIADFMWGGMENTSMTTVNERFLILPKHRDDVPPDGLVAHEAAHQWFGDLVTSKSWDHIWLNEGFATYFDALFHEAFFGSDLFHLELLENAEAYLAEDREQYRRPIVTRVFHENEDLFDRHTYQKGGWVLHMLRHELGDELWWKSIRHYVKKNEWKNVETNDLKIAIEEATGRNLDWFFDQWVYKAGHPEIEIGHDYDEDRKQLRVSVKQKQRVIDTTPLFRFPLTIWVWLSKTERKEHVLNVRNADESFFLPVARRPECVQVDPDLALLKALTWEKSSKEWVFQLQHAPTAHARMEACRALARKASDTQSTDALGQALRTDAFWGVRRAAAQALGEQRTGPAREALTRGVADKHPRVRRAVARALGAYRRDEAAVKVLQGMIRDETKSDYVVAAALYGLAQTRDPSAFATLKKHLGRESHNEIIRTSVLAAFGELRDARAIPLLIEHSKYGVQQYVRSAATNTLGRLWEYVERKHQEDIQEELVHLMRDPSHMQRRSSYLSAGQVPVSAVGSTLGAQIDAEPIGLLKKVARESLRSVREKMGEQAQIGGLKRQLEEIQSENKKLLARFAELEAKLGPKGKPGKKRSKR